jgi:hypothetical protein
MPASHFAQFPRSISPPGEPGVAPVEHAGPSLPSGPTVCLCCGSPRLRKLGEDITETLEVIPPAVEGDPACPREA